MKKKKISLAEKVAKARAMKFKMPDGITSTKTRLPDGVWAYVFRHHEIGELGRLIILPHSHETSQFVCEVVGEPDDPMTKIRRKILEPITKELLKKMEFVCGTSTQETPRPYTLQKPQQCIESKVMPCEQCGLPTAMLIFAVGARTADELADYARLMYKKVKELNVPTWVIGDSREVNVNGEMAGEGLVMKIWPRRLKAKVICSLDLNAQLDALMEKHCVG